ncbi:hypothetical protein PM082_001147 [Marasmius tenuissimus]|nr:hypothetical protein PM082_001147 [Marasmius tenuissimus]
MKSDGARRVQCPVGTRTVAAPYHGGASGYLPSHLNPPRSRRFSPSLLHYLRYPIKLVSRGPKKTSTQITLLDTTLSADYHVPRILDLGRYQFISPGIKPDERIVGKLFENHLKSAIRVGWGPSRPPLPRSLERPNFLMPNSLPLQCHILDSHPSRSPSTLASFQEKHARARSGLV